MCPDSDNTLKEGHGEYKYYETFINLEKVDKIADEECTEYVRKGEDRVKELELFFADMQGLLDWLCECLWVVEGVVVAKTGEGDEAKGNNVDSCFWEGEFVRQVKGSIVCHILYIKYLLK